MQIRSSSGLNAIVHPRIIARAEELAAEYRKQNPHAVVIVDAALIFESGIGGTMRKVIVAWCRPEQQLERLMAKTGVSREEAEHRIQAQMPVEEKRRRADYLIDCSGTLEQSRAQAEAIYLELGELSRGRHAGSRWPWRAQRALQFSCCDWTCRSYPFCHSSARLRNSSRVSCTC